MPRPFTPRQVDENLRFLAVLGETGNARLAARGIRRAGSTMHGRRKASAAFAQEWDAAAAAAHARFHLGGGRRGPEREVPKRVRERRLEAGRDPSLRTRGGEAVVVRTKTGRLQLRLAQPGKVTRAGEQAFLAALSATCNVRLSAAAAGFSAGAFYRRQRKDPAFAREMRLALKMGYDRLECAMLQAAAPESGVYDAWQSNDPPPVPPLTADQALQLLFLHEKSVRQGWEKPHRRRRRGEPWEVYRERLAAMWECEKAREAEASARAYAFEQTGCWRLEREGPPPPPLPPLHLVTGWSKAKGRPPYHPGVALFGGWRIEDMRHRLKDIA